MLKFKKNNFIKIIKSELMAYLYMPLIFAVCGYMICFLLLTPVLDMLQAMGGMMIADEIPDFNQSLNSIYDPEAAEKNREEAVSIKDITIPAYGTLYAHISCEKIGLDAPVYWGDNNEILKAGVGQYIGSFMPGFEKTILLSGHNTTDFKCLQNIELGDIITVTTNYGIYEYEVEDIQVIHMDTAEAEIGDILGQDKEQLITYTCYPFEKMVGRKVDRYFIFSKKLSGPVVE